MVLGGGLAVIALLAGEWVEAREKVDSESKTNSDVAVGFGPSGLFYKLDQSSQAAQIPVSLIEATWESQKSVFNPEDKEGVDGKSTAALLGNSYNLVAAGVRQARARQAPGYLSVDVASRIVIWTAQGQAAAPAVELRALAHLGLQPTAAHACRRPAR